VTRATCVRLGVVVVLAVTVMLVVPGEAASRRGAFAALAEDDQRVARALYEAQQASGVRPWTLDEIATRRRSASSWQDVFAAMRATGLVREKSLKQVLRRYGRPAGDAGPAAGEPASAPPPTPANPTPAPPAPRPTSPGDPEPVTASPPVPAVPPAPAAAPAPEPATAERWGMQEIVLRATGAYRQPFGDVLVTATFRHESGRTHQVFGFYDGDGQGGQEGSVWKVRFMPTEPGRWTWATAATPPDPGLHGLAGTVFAGPPAPGNRGPLTRPRAPYLFPAHADGSYTFLIGVWARPWEFEPDARAALYDTLQGHGITRLRLWLPAGAKFDGDYGRYNLGFMHALDTTVRELQARGLVADLILYNNDDERDMTRRQDEQYLRYVLARYGAFRAVTVTIANQVDWHYAGHDSGLNDVQASTDWGNAAGEYLQSINAFRVLATQHHPGENHRGLVYYLPALAEWPFAAWSDWIMKQLQVTALSAAQTLEEVEPRSCTLNERGLARLNAIVLALRERFRQAVSVDEYSFESDGCTPSWKALSATGTRKTHWVVTASGAWGSTSLVGIQEDVADVEVLRRRPTLAQLGIVARVMRTLPFWEMTPANAIVSPNPVVIGGEAWRTTFAIGKPGVAYLVYALNGGAGTVTLPAGTYRVIRVDPRTGEEVELGTVHGGAVPFALPGARPADHNTGDSDWVLLYVAPGARRS